MEARGFCGDNRDKGGYRRVPHDHGTPMGPDFLQGKIRVVGVLGVEVADIVAIKWEKEGREITLEEHRLGQEN